MLFFRYIQVLSLTYIAFYEWWPYDFVSLMGDYFSGFGCNFIYLNNGFYDFIVDDTRYLYNILAWLALLVVITIFACMIIFINKLRHEFKHSKTLLKKWAFNFGELVYLPIIMNLIPMLACEYKTIKNGYQQHK